MCLAGSAPKAPKPPPPPAPAAPVEVPTLNTARDEPGMDKSMSALNRKGRKGLRIDMTQGGGGEGSGLNIPQ